MPTCKTNSESFKDQKNGSSIGILYGFVIKYLHFYCDSEGFLVKYLHMLLSSKRILWIGCVIFGFHVAGFAFQMVPGFRSSLCKKFCIHRMHILYSLCFVVQMYFWKVKKVLCIGTNGASPPRRVLQMNSSAFRTAAETKPCKRDCNTK